MLYQPAPSEIAATVARGCAKHPALTARWERAAAILADPGRPLHWPGAGCNLWRCLASDGSHEYTVTFGACDCPDSDRCRDLVEGCAFCKHRLALLALREIYASHMQSRLLGNYRGSQDWRRLRSEPNAGLLLNDQGMILYCHDPEDHIPSPLCAFRSSPRGVMPATPLDLGIFATWLAHARPLSPSAAAGILFNQLVAAGRSREEAAGAADDLVESPAEAAMITAYEAATDADMQTLHQRLTRMKLA